MSYECSKCPPSLSNIHTLLHTLAKVPHSIYQWLRQKDHFISSTMWFEALRSLLQLVVGFQHSMPHTTVKGLRSDEFGCHSSFLMKSSQLAYNQSYETQAVCAGAPSCKPLSISAVALLVSFRIKWTIQ